ncbi:hypothetical protein EYC84_011281 [Monilinia fructicola]|uniref:Rhodopsin domain-containing protein n=1 Tax=Monilinia fructicola TaxID=38448 RepID=A0A5M9J6G6_MONFR|nr:hypothetical protein EYC84_011281 [Monilinia fructicola]
MSLKTPTYPGINLNADEGPLLKAVSYAFISLTVMTIAVRSFSRWYTKISFGLDDLFILIAAILSIAYTAIILVEVQDNFYGQHIGKSDSQHLEAYMKGLYLLAITYPVALSMSKLSLLALYWRVFAVTGGRIPILLAGGVNGAWGFAALFVGIFSCHPIQGFWDSSIPAKCINYPVFFTSNEAFTILFDIVVLFIPVWFIAQIKRSVGERISISSTFLLGLVVTVVSAIRLWRLVVAQRLPSLDSTFNEIDAGLWAIIELNLWILVASIPTFRPLLGKISRQCSAKRSGINVSGSGGSSEHPLSKIRSKTTTGTFFQKQQRNLDLDTESVFGFGDLRGGMESQGSGGSEMDVERSGTSGRAGTAVSGDSGYDDGLSITVVDVEGSRNAYGYACPRSKDGSCSMEEEGLSMEMRDLAGIRVQKDGARDCKRNAGVWRVQSG